MHDGRWVNRRSASSRPKVVPQEDSQGIGWYEQPTEHQAGPANPDGVMRPTGGLPLPQHCNCGPEPTGETRRIMQKSVDVAKRHWWRTNVVENGRTRR